MILSSDDVMADDRQQRCNVVLGSKKQPAEQARHHHVILDGADGLEFATLVDCSLVYVARSGGRTHAPPGERLRARWVFAPHKNPRENPMVDSERPEVCFSAS